MMSSIEMNNSENEDIDDDEDIDDEGEVDVEWYPIPKVLEPYWDNHEDDEDDEEE